MIASLAALLCACSMVFAQSGYKTVENIPYAKSSDSYALKRCFLDVYYPEDATDAPVVVWYHGGGLTGGNKYIPQELKGCGLVVVAVNYRLMPKCSISDCIDDAAASVAWTFENIHKYGGSPKKIFVTGHSAGGYLTSMIGLEKKWLAKYGIDADSIAGLVPFSGQAITHFALREQQGIGQLQATVDQFAPLYHVRKDCPPMLIISADREQEMNGRYEEQAFFWRMMKLTGHPDVSILEMQGYNHGDMPHPAFPVLRKFISRITR